ncbi:hypothetical protein Tco_0237266 [Tanacetum coccineum]
MVAYLEKSEGKQFWQTAALSTNEDGVRGITATIDRKVNVFVSEATIRRHIKIEDSEGLKTLPTSKKFEQLALMGLSLNELIDLCTSLSKKVTSLESELKQTKQTYRAALTKLIKRVKKLEQTIKTSQARRRAKVLGVFSAAIALADAAKRRQSVKNVQTYTRRRREVSTGSGGVSTASRLVSTADISTANELDSTASVKAKDKGKVIMHESEPPKKIKKKVQVQMSVNEELAKKVFEEEQARFNAEHEARFKAEQEQERINFETALELQKQLDEREEVTDKVDQAHDIDWSDPAVIRYHTLQNRRFSVAEVRKNMCLYLKNQGGYKMSHFEGMSYEDIRPIFERVWDQNQAFIPMGSKIEKKVMKTLGFDLQQESLKLVEEEIVQQDCHTRQFLEILNYYFTL